MNSIDTIWTRDLKAVRLLRNWNTHTGFWWSRGNGVTLHVFGRRFGA